MRTLGGLALAVVFAAIAAGVWVGLSQVWDVRLLVLLACFVGSGAGYGMALGSRCKGGLGTALLAACVCLGVCVAAKGVIAYFRATDYVHEQMVATDDDVYSDIADQHFFAMLEDGQITQDELDDDYPQEVYDAADEQWAAMSPEEIEQYKAGLSARWGEHEDVAIGATSVFAFLFSWGLLDLICVGSAIGAAFKIGSFTKDPAGEEIPAWALGTASATGDPAKSAAMTAGHAAATPAAEVAPGPTAGPLAGAMPSAATGAPTMAPSMARKPAAIKSEPEDAAASFWTRLGSEPPARNTPSLRRDPKPASPAGPATGNAAVSQPPRSEAA